MLRIMKIALVLGVALWGILGVRGNLIDLNGTIGAVGAVTSMATFPGGAARWEATTNPAVILAGAAFIVLFKLATVTLCLAGAWRMWAARKSDAETFARAKSWALAGCAVAVFSLFVGWTVIGESWFEFWRSDALRPAADGAFRYAGFIALISLMVGARDSDAKPA